MLLRQISDIHFEVSSYVIPEDPKDKDAVLVLCGDVEYAKNTHRYTEFLKPLCSRFKHVIVIAGNHEYWGCSLIRTIEKMRSMVDAIQAEGILNITFLENESVVIDDVAIIGSTLWTDIKPVDEFNVRVNIRDYRKIRSGPAHMPWERKLAPCDVTFLHYNSKKKIEELSAYHKDQGLKVLVVSHHAPSSMSIDPRYTDCDLNPAYYSDLSALLCNETIDHWMHGHMHHFCDYMAHTCRVTCNPRGYHNFIIDEDTGFIENFFVELRN